MNEEKKKLGRPKNPDGTGVQKTMYFRPEVLEQAKKNSIKHGLSVGKYVAKLVIQDTDSMRNKKSQ